MVRRLQRAFARRLRSLRFGAGEGFNLVLLAMAITVMNVMVAAAMPTWTAIIQRDKEAELIFRGLQYAEAIRVFQQRFGRMPVRLEELLEVRPRSIRQLWENPMMEDGRWGLVVMTAGGRPPNPDGQGGGQPTPPQGPGGTVGIDPGPDGEVTAAPLRGVYSPEGGAAFRTYFGSETISEWQFTVEQLSPPQRAPSAPASPNSAAVNADDVGRAFPPGVTPQVGGPAAAPGGKPGGELGGGGQLQPARPDGGKPGGGRSDPEGAGKG